MEELVRFSSEVGFPIMVTLYLLHRMEQKLDAVIHSIERLQGSVEVFYEKEDRYALRKQQSR